MFKNLILDWSGTLCNDLPPVLETINRILDHYQVENISEAAFLEEFRLPFDSFYQARVPHATPDELESLFRRYFAEATLSAEPIRHASEFVRARHGEGCRLIVLSAVTASHFHAQAEALELHHLFESCYLDVRDKREVIEDLLMEQQLEPADTCFIGDMEHDVLAAKRGGITSIAVLTGYDSVAKLETAQPDLIVRDLEKLDRLFRRHRMVESPTSRPS